MTRSLASVAGVCAALTAVACVGEPDKRPQPYPTGKLAEGGEVVAKIGPVTLTSEELQKRLAGQSPVMMERLSETDRRKDFLEQQVRFELLAQEGWSRGMYLDEDVIAATKKAIVQKLIAQELDKRTAETNISEADLRAEYAKSEAEFNKPETIRLSQIVRAVSDEKDREKERALLERLKNEVLEAEKKNTIGAFAEAAKRHSEDGATKNGGGQLDFMSRTELEAKYGAEVAKVIFEDAKVGDVVVADAPNASLLLKKTGQRRGVQRTLEMVKPQLRARILRDRRNAAFDALAEDLKKQHGVTVDLAALERMELGGARTGTTAQK